MNKSRLGALTTGLGTAAVAVLLAVQPAVAAPAGPILHLAALAFEATSVDVTSDYAVVGLGWTVTDRAAGARNVHGVVELRQFAGGDQVGPARSVTWNLEPGVAQVYDPFGTAQRSSYTYQFVVPRFGSAAHAVWRVTKVTIADDLGHARTVPDAGLAGFSRTLRVTQLVDSTGPQLDQLYKDFQQPAGVYDSGAGVTLKYGVSVTDDAGFWKGKLTLAGPGGRRLTSSFAVEGDGVPQSCGDEQVYDPTWMNCTISVRIPAGTPSGAWSVARVELTDNVGNTRRITSPAGPSPIRVSHNDTVSASNFALTKTVVDSWRQPATTELTFTPSGAVGGLTSVDLDLDWCWQPSRTPVVNADGTVSVGISMQTFSVTCTIRGVELIDGAGHVAFYGAAHAAPDLGLTIRRLPDTEPPVVLAASLPKDTWTQSEIDAAWGIGVDVTVDTTSPAPVNGESATLYDSAGVSRGGGSGGVSEPPDGKLSLSVHTSGLEPGDYTVGFSLTDAAGNSSHWGYPNINHPAPTGPLILHVVAG